ncbi:hypothetical protein GCM10027176_53680 [Actinoallomurus bryophytorum]|uniref:Uncharacterized protein n=1 Tax=Actinoallomurus bryophytorum TaxID=1490222 RepID=A0A543CQS0_9ACTN|nr:hypothetical protein [Actinoallomurus bryophytorum]TQL99446.1 hypothetical protein FB559_5132 [Actinoallomurus bryophytorum]
MVRPENIQLSLTGPASHLIEVPPGQGSLSIGPVVPGAAEPDVVVGPDDVLDWTAFDAFPRSAGYHWPRELRYQGNDVGFLAWSHRRRIEQFHWVPTTLVTADAGVARIDHLTVTLRGAGLKIVLPPAASTFTAKGDLSRLRAETAPGGTCPHLYFYPDTSTSRDAAPSELPPLPALGEATSVYVGVKPLRQPFDCASLLQFPQLTMVRLSGRLTNLKALAELSHLRRVQLVDCPDLTGLPALTTWPELRDFEASNIDAAAGRDLRQQLKDHPLPQASVAGLRAAGWFERDQALPFGAWPAASARRATKAFRAAEAADDPEKGIRAFVHAINELPGIDALEREDAGEAVILLAARAKISKDRALSWFDADRDF